MRLSLDKKKKNRTYIFNVRAANQNKKLLLREQKKKNFLKINSYRY